MESPNKGPWSPRARVDFDRSCCGGLCGVSLVWMVDVEPPACKEGYKYGTGEERETRKPSYLVGAGRFELPTSWSRTKRASRAALRPECSTKDSGISAHNQRASRDNPSMISSAA